MIVKKDEAFFIRLLLYTVDNGAEMDTKTWSVAVSVVAVLVFLLLCSVTMAILVLWRAVTMRRAKKTSAKTGSSSVHDVCTLSVVPSD